MSQSKKIIGATFLLMGVTFLTKAISFVREMFIAAHFGTSQEADIFVAVLTIPTLFLTISSGAMSAALVPMVIRLSQDGISRLKDLLSSMFSLTTLIMLGITAILYIFIKPFTDLYVVGFDDAAKLMTMNLFKIMFPALIVIGLISLFSAILNAKHHFFAPSLGPVFYSLGVIIATVFFSKTYGIKSLVIGLVLGLIAQFLLVLIVNRIKGTKFSIYIKINEDLKKVGHLIIPIFLGVGVFQINIIVDRMMASTLPSGSLAALNYANRITQLPLSIFVGSMVLPLFPAIADKIAKKDFEGTKQLLSKSYHLLGILLLPIIGTFIILSGPIVAILFQRGQFDANATHITSLALIFYSILILPFAMRDVITRALYSLQDTWTPVINSVMLVTLNIILMVIFVPKIGLIGVAGSTSVSAIFGYVRLRDKLNKKIGKSDTKREFRTWLFIWRNAIIFTFVLWSSYHLLMNLWQQPIGIQLWLRMLSSLIIAGVIYILLTINLKIEEVDWLKKRFIAGFQKVMK